MARMRKGVAVWLLLTVAVAACDFGGEPATTSTSPSTVAGPTTSVGPQAEAPDVSDADDLAWDPGRRQALLVGATGTTGNPLDATWLLDADMERWQPVVTDMAPVPRVGASAVYVPSLDAFLLVGGARLVFARLGCVAGVCDVGFLDDAWLLSPDTGWARLDTDPSPLPRIGAGIVYDPGNDVVVLFGGTGEPSAGTGNKGTLLGDTWIFSPLTAQWEAVPSPEAPGARTQPAMAYDPATAKVYLYGGRDYATTDPPHDLWAFDAAAGTWEQIPLPEDAPGPRWRATMRHDPAGGGLVLFGGRRFEAGAETSPTRVWRFDPIDGTWQVLLDDAGTSGPGVIPGDGSILLLSHDGVERLDLLTGVSTLVVPAPGR